MATIPLQLAQRRLDTGNVISYPGGSPVGAAMQGFGDELSAVAERFRQQKQQQEAFDAEIVSRQFDGQIAQAEDEAIQNAPADGSGLHDSMYGQVDPRTGRVNRPGLFDTLFDGIVPKIPKGQRANFIKQREALRATGSTRMAAQQQARRDQYEQAEWARVENIYTGSIAQSDPDDTGTFEAIRQNGFDLIGKMGNPLARQAAEAAWRSNTAKALVQAMIAQDPKRAAEMLDAGPVNGGRTRDDTVEAVGGPQASGSGVLATRKALAGGLPPDERPARGNSVQPDGKALWAAAPWIADLSPDAVRDLSQKAQVAMTAQLFDARTNIDLAYQNAPDALMYTGNYSGEIPGPEDFTAVYGAEEGGKQVQGLDRTFDAGRQAFGMVRMPNDAIEAKVLAAKPKPDSATPERDQAQFEITASAAKQVLHARATAPTDFARKVDASLDAAWNEVSKPDSYDPTAWQKAIARSVAVQQQLGIKNIQPLPQRIVKNLVDTLLNQDVPQADKEAALSDLFAGTSGPSVLAAMSWQLARSGLSRLLRGTALELPMTPAEMRVHEAELAGMAQNPPGVEEFSKYDKTLRDKVAAWALGDNKASSAWGNIVKGALGSRGAGGNDSSLVDFTPLGALFSADEAARAFEKGNYGEAALDAAGAIPAGAVAAGFKRVGKLAKLDKLFSRVSELYPDIPDLPQRPFEKDYPNGPLAGEKGKLQYGSRGHELVAKYIAGRMHVGADDLALTPSDVRAIGEEITGNPIIFKSPDPGEEDWIGKIEPDASGRLQIYIKPDLPDNEYNEAVLHEVAHAIDLMAGPISSSDALHELRPVYSIQAGGNTTDNVLTPQRLGYEDHLAPYEYAAEAIRAYLANPNYFKSVAPLFAARIQDVVNTHPVLKHIIQFNSLLAAAGTVAGAAATSRTEGGGASDGKL